MQCAALTMILMRMIQTIIRLHQVRRETRNQKERMGYDYERKEDLIEASKNLTELKSVSLSSFRLSDSLSLVHFFLAIGHCSDNK